MSLSVLSEAFSDFGAAVDAFLRPHVFLGKQKSKLDAQIDIPNDDVKLIALNNVLLRMDYAGSSTEASEKRLPKKRFKHLVDTIRADLVSTEPQIRKDAFILVGRVLERCPGLKVTEPTAKMLIELCCSRLFDWYSVEGSLMIFLGLLQHHEDLVRWATVEVDLGEPLDKEAEKSSQALQTEGSHTTKEKFEGCSAGADEEELFCSAGVTPTATSKSDGSTLSSAEQPPSRLERVSCVRAILEGIFRRVHGPGFAQPIRHMIYKILRICLDNFSQEIYAIGPRAVTGVCCQVENEKDPRNLLLVFPLMAKLLSSFEELIQEDQQHLELLADVLLVYFPIRFRPPPNDPYRVTEEDLKSGLLQCLFASKLMGPLILETVLDVLSDAINAGKDSDVHEALAALTTSTEKFHVTTIAEHTMPFFEIVKLTSWQMPCRYLPAVAKVFARFLCVASKASPTTVERACSDCFDHMLKPEMLPESPGLHAARVVVQEIAREGNTMVHRVLCDVSSQYVENLIQMVTVLCLPSSSPTSSSVPLSRPLSEMPSPSWTRVEADAAFLASLASVSALPSTVGPRLWTLMAEHGSKLCSQPPAAGSLLRLLAFASREDTKASDECTLLLLRMLGVPSTSLTTGPFLSSLPLFQRLVTQDLRLCGDLEAAKESFVYCVYDSLASLVATATTPAAHTLVSTVAAVLRETHSIYQDNTYLTDEQWNRVKIVLNVFNHLLIALGAPPAAQHGLHTPELPNGHEQVDNAALQHPNVPSEHLNGNAVTAATCPATPDAPSSHDDLSHVACLGNKIVKELFETCDAATSLFGREDLPSSSVQVVETLLKLLSSITHYGPDDPTTREAVRAGLAHLFVRRETPCVIRLTRLKDTKRAVALLAQLGDVLATVADVMGHVALLSQVLHVVVDFFACQSPTDVKDGLLLALLPRPLKALLSHSDELPEAQQIIQRIEDVVRQRACDDASHQPEVAMVARVCLTTLILNGSETQASNLVQEIDTRWMASCQQYLDAEDGAALVDMTTARAFVLRGWLLRSLHCASHASYGNLASQLMHQLDSSKQLSKTNALILLLPFTLRSILRSCKEHQPQQLPDVSPSFVNELAQHWLPTLAARVQDTQQSSTARLEAVATAICLLFHMSLSDLDTLADSFENGTEQLASIFLYALKSSPWVLPQRGSVELQAVLDELSGLSITSLLRMLLYQRRHASSETPTRVVQTILDTCLSSENIELTAEACVRHCKQNSIPLMRQASIRCLYTMGQLCRRFPATERCVATVLDGIRPALDDPHQEVRRGAAACANFWSCLAS